MSIIDFLQTRTGQNLVAVLITIIIGLAFLRNRSKRKKQAASVPSAQWTISQRYMYLNAVIISCTSLEELHQVKKLVKGFARETFSELPTIKERHRYTSRLLESYYSKETSFTQIADKVALCAN